jgi:hypothetical protein
MVALIVDRIPTLPEEALTLHGNNPSGCNSENFSVQPFANPTERELMILATMESVSVESHCRS